MIEHELISKENYFLSEEKQYEYCKDTLSLATGIKKAFMVLAERLYKIKTRKLYKSFHEKWYMYLDEIELHESVASRLITIYEKLVQSLDVKMDQIQNVEYSKLYEIQKVSDTKDIAMYWIEQVNSEDEEQRLTLKDLKAKINAMNAGITEDAPCEHKETYLIRCCRCCKDSWEEFPDTTK
jgi:hypothetical protein